MLSESARPSWWGELVDVNSPHCPSINALCPMLHSPLKPKPWITLHIQHLSRILSVKDSSFGANAKPASTHLNRHSNAAMAALSSSEEALVVLPSLPTPREEPDGVESEARLLEAFAAVPSVSKCWAFPQDDGSVRMALQMTQRNLPANSNRK
jgi:hypothetical protein